MQKTLKIVVTVCFILFFYSGQSQTMEEAGTEYNKAIELSKNNDYKGAITGFEKSIKMLDKILLNADTEVSIQAEQMKAQAQQQLPNLYFKSGTGLYKEKKFDEALAEYKKTVEVCEKYNETKIKEKTNYNIAVLYTMKASSAYKAKEYEKAVALYDNALAAKGNYTKALFQKGLSLNKLDKDDEMIATLEKAIEVGEETDKDVMNSKKLLASHFSVKGAKLIKNKDYDGAVELQNKALSYDETYATAYYYLAAIYNLEGKHDEAIEAANKGIENEKDDAEDKARYYFELGLAQKAQGKSTEACEAFKKANVGSTAKKVEAATKEMNCN